MARRPWEQKVPGTSPPLTLYERPDRGERIYLKWAAGDSHQRPALYPALTVRDDKGKVCPARVARVIQCAVEQQALALGAAALQDLDRGDLPETVRTLGEAVQLMLLTEYNQDSRNLSDLERYGRRLVQVMEADTPLKKIRTSDFKRAWQALARTYRQTGVGGVRATEMTVQLFRQVMAWAAENDYVKTVVAPRTNWRRKLRDDWAKITGGRTPASTTGKERRERGHRVVRFSREEAAALERELQRTDPRFRLLWEVGIEHRGGQVIRTRRSDLELEPLEGEPWGGWNVPDGGPKKPGGYIVLSRRQRAAVDHALATWLSELERAYQARVIDDYCLFPGGILGACARLPQGERPIDRSSLRRWLKGLEAAAGVRHLAGRGLHGMRRFLANEAERLVRAGELDERTADALGGWEPGSLARRRHYTDDARMEAQQRAVTMRERIRSGGSK